MKIIRKWKAFIAVGVLLFASGVTGLHLLVVWHVQFLLAPREVSFEDDAPLATLNKQKSDRQKIIASELAALEPSVPMTEVDPFDEDADCWSNWASQYGAAGAVVFDANGDGRLDVYFPQDGQNWTRPTDAKGVLKDGPRYQKNGLYLNQGTDASGQPTFIQVSKLAAKNNLFVKEELLIEDYLFPRETVTDSTKRWGRSSNMAVAADFNNDGRLDLYIGNEPQGMQYAHPDAHVWLGQFVNPIGRSARNTKQPIDSHGTHLISYQPRFSLIDKRASARGEEFEGANSLYLNMGDQDGDGIPEWKDASRETGLEGFRPTYSIAVADVDLDGDLDVYVGNVMDVDMFPHGAKKYAGGANCLYLNQIAQTGKLTFVDAAEKMNVDGIYDEENPMPAYEKLRRIPLLPIEYSVLFFKAIPHTPEWLSLDGHESEHGQISWSTVFQDVNLDGWPDIWVANDLGFLNLYINKEGKRFEKSDHARSKISGSWMTLAPADFNGNGHEDLFAGNLGGGVYNVGFVAPSPYDLFEPATTNSMGLSQLFTGKSDSTHAMIDGKNVQTEIPNRVLHSSILPPDASLPNNIREPPKIPGTVPLKFDADTLDPYEFAWGSAVLDIQNDGRPDLYFMGGMLGRGGGLLPIMGTSPGRLLVNGTQNGGPLRFSDLTSEHHLFNILELHYDHLKSERYLYRKAPAQNWSKRDRVFSYDRGSWIAQGAGIQERVTFSDMIQTAENGRSVIAADLNGDGYEDLLLRNQGGYDSRSPLASNLKCRVQGRPVVVPAHNYNYPTPTQYEPGRTRLFLNQYKKNNWLKIRLVDDAPKSFNRQAVGARVILNKKHMRVKRIGEGGYLSSKNTNLHFGLAQEVGEHIQIHWPDRQRSISNIRLHKLTNGVLTISKTKGITSWQAQAE